MTIKDIDFKSYLKIAGIALIAIIMISFALKLFGSAYKTTFKGTRGTSESSLSAPGYDMGGFKGKAFPSDGITQELSVRNIMPPIEDEYSSGADAEDFEVTDYRATIETAHLKQTCGIVLNLKQKDYVIFENSNEYDSGCNYTFKVEKDQVEEILGVIDGLDPEDLITNTRTIKNTIEDFTSEQEVLEKKRKSIVDTLDSAILSYDEIADLATQTRDAESLAKIIDSKIRIIERLTRERIAVNEELDRLARAKAQQLDKLEYTYFNVSVYENKYIDGEVIKNSWKQAIKAFVRDMNDTLQDISINLIAILLRAVLVIIYLVIVLYAAKYGWKFAKRVWKK